MNNAQGSHYFPCSTARTREYCPHKRGISASASRTLCILHGPALRILVRWCCLLACWVAVGCCGLCPTFHGGETAIRVFDDIGLSPQDTVLDLGCGDGRWLLAAALRGCTGRGLDLNEDLLQKGRRAAADAGVASLIVLEKKDMFCESLAHSTVIILYLFREGLAEMKDKLEAGADHGARVVSVGIRGWAPISTVEVGGLHAYIYRLPDHEALLGLGDGGGK